MAWSIPSQEKLKYDQIFDGLIPVSGLLSGEKVKPILLNSKLPVDVLGRVWELSDIDKDGFLDRDEFTVAMHLVYRALEKIPVPNQLPTEMVPLSKRHLPIPVLPAITPVVAPTLAPVVSGYGPVLPGTVVPVITPAAKIVVTPSERAHYDDLFVKYDLDKDGFLNGADVKDVFLQSGLPQMVLAHIWNLCDTTAAGKLTKDQFALSMYLVQQKLKGAELPTLITQDMLPPSIQLPSLLSTTSMSLHMDQTTMKELDAITNDIDELKKEKMTLEQEKVQKEADMRVIEGEISNMQKDLDGLLFTMQQLECQKAEAQKKLDELEDKKHKLQASVVDCKEKYDSDQLKIQELRNMINNKNPQAFEDEMKQMRVEIDEMMTEERDLEKKYQLAINKEKKLNETLAHLEELINKQSKKNVADLKGTNQEEDDKASSSLFDLKDMWSFPVGSKPNDTTTTTTTTTTATTTTTTTTTTTATTLFNNTQLDQDDPFASSDPFSNPLVTSDPFGADPFKDTFDGEKQTNDDLSSNFNVNFTQVASVSTTSDPWSTLGGGGGGKVVHDISQLDPFGLNSELAQAFPHDTSDPFGTGSFNPPPKHSNPSTTKTTTTSSPQLPALPPKLKKSPAPPRPPAPKPNEPFASAGGVHVDPFEGKLNVKGGKKENMKFRSEAEQIAWATKDSEQEYERLKRLRQQEEADLKLAIALSKQEMKSK